MAWESPYVKKPYGMYGSESRGDWQKEFYDDLVELCKKHQVTNLWGFDDQCLYATRKDSPLQYWFNEIKLNEANNGKDEKENL